AVDGTPILRALPARAADGNSCGSHETRSRTKGVALGGSGEANAGEFAETRIQPAVSGRTRVRILFPRDAAGCEFCETRVRAGRPAGACAGNSFATDGLD